MQYDKPDYHPSAPSLPLFQYPQQCLTNENNIAEGKYDYVLESHDEEDGEENFKTTDGLADNSFTNQYLDQKKERLRNKLNLNQKRVFAMWRRNSRLKSRADQLYYTLQTLKKKNHDLTVDLTKMFEDQFHRNTDELMLKALNVLKTPSHHQANWTWNFADLTGLKLNF